MEKRKIAFQTLGCKLNFAETSSISRMFSPENYEHVSYKEKADIYVVHSCSVTTNAEKKTRAAIRHAKKLNPGASVAVIGCYAQLRPRELAEMTEVDVILGNREKYRLAGIYQDNEHPLTMQSDDSGLLKDYTYKPAYSSDERTRSFLKIQDGCDYFCAYCTVPFARGRSRSNSVNDVVQTAQDIARSKIKEIILTGVNIGDFGRQSGENLADLIKELDKVQGIDRYRISSIEPDLINKNIINIISKSQKFLHHFHIPLQSGSNEVLKHMERRYQRELFAGNVRMIKEKMPDACIAVDLIVGFPGETQEDFKTTEEFIKSLPVSYLHVFTYSRRPDTKAAHMKNQIPENVKKQRSEKMHEVSERLKQLFYQSQKGKKQEVLWESNRDGNDMQGWTGNYIKVKTTYDADRVNTIEKVSLNHLENGHFRI